MAEITVKNLSNKVVGEQKVDDSLVKAKFRPHLMHDYVTMQRRAHRQGTHSTKTRAEVSGTGKKPFRQKGTGNARQGTLIGPHQPGGGIAFGPKPRDYTTRLNRKTKAEAIRQSISQKEFEKKLFVIDSFEIASGKTKDAAKALGTLGVSSVLICGTLSEATLKSLRNIPEVKVVKPIGLNVLDVLKHSYLIFTQEGLQAVGERLKVAA
jgi:large subunit ribosomal protein L4